MGPVGGLTTPHGHPLHVVRHLRSYTKVRYRGLAKNTVERFTLLALSNLYRLRYRFCPRLRPAA